MHSEPTLLQTLWGPCSLILLTLAGVIGLVALVSPKAFRSIAELGGRWLDSDRLLARLDKRIDVDRLVLPYSRWLGAAVIVSVAILGFRLTIQ